MEFRWQQQLLLDGCADPILESSKVNTKHKVQNVYLYIQDFKQPHLFAVSWNSI